MNGAYISYRFTVAPKAPASEILIAELALIGFESFEENQTGVVAYIKKKDWNTNILKDVSILKSKVFSIEYTSKEIAPTNWNATWEKNFSPIQIANLVNIRASFHKKSNLKYDIIITPKMSFGTGHHQTTYMMIEHLLSLQLTDKKVLDMGCGTGILSIFAQIKGASAVDAIDIDAWSYKNTLENIAQNQCKNISVFQGDISLLSDKKYDLITANINRNIILKDLKIYADSLLENGILLLSGFYKAELSQVDAIASKYGLTLEKTIQKDNWVALRYYKN